MIAGSLVVCIIRLMRARSEVVILRGRRSGPDLVFRLGCEEGRGRPCEVMPDVVRFCLEGEDAFLFGDLAGDFFGEEDAIGDDDGSGC